MVNLFFYFNAFKFSQGCSVLHASFKASSAALHKEIEAAIEAETNYQTYLNQGGVPIVEREDGEVLYYEEQRLEAEVETAREAAMQLRKAYAIAIYHHWERSIRSWTKAAPDKNFFGLLEAAIAAGVLIDPKMGAVKDLANLLKHANKKRADDLQKSWPEVLGGDTAFAIHGGNWYEAVRLTDRHIEEAIGIVERSGPIAKSALIQ